MFDDMIVVFSINTHHVFEWSDLLKLFANVTITASTGGVTVGDVVGERLELEFKLESLNAEGVEDGEMISEKEGNTEFIAFDQFKVSPLLFIFKCVGEYLSELQIFGNLRF